MKRHLLHDGIILLQLQSCGRIFLVLRGDVSADARQAAVLMFGAFENYLNPVFFLRHDIRLLTVIVLIELNGYALLFHFLQHGRNSFFVDRADGAGGDLQFHPTVFFGNEEALFLQIGLKTAI
jgi:hypothetical protein